VSNKGGLWIREKRAPIVGNVCMDVTMVDLSDIPDARVGDDVVVWGDGAKGFPTIEEVATLAGTIPYEILCRVSPRVQRIMQLA
jgi:alanine racemase